MLGRLSRLLSLLALLTLLELLSWNLAALLRRRLPYFGLQIHISTSRDEQLNDVCAIERCCKAQRRLSAFGFLRIGVGAFIE